jgi:fructokinase
VLWDCLPRGLFLGGAPMNAAYHLARQGFNVLPLTAVGRDLLGAEALRRMRSWGVDTRFVTQHADAPTGTVSATLNTKGAASYRIERNVAWDRIEVSERLTKLATAPAAIVFGTLALRSAGNRRALTKLLAGWPAALRVVDLNLRAPFDGKAMRELALKAAQLLKLNDEELGTLVGRRLRGSDQLATAARRLAQDRGIERICVTAGARGAGLWWEGEWMWEQAKPVDVRDTVGAGDAFLAGLLGTLLRGGTAREALRRACRLGEFVASRDGATPDYSPREVWRE